jgi:glycosyltransferase involved in cell wall biosynthesis
MTGVAHARPDHPEPLVSIVIPAFNAAPYIAMTLESVRAQTYRHWEAIVVDDGSSDGTAAIVESVRDERIRLIKQPNQGVCRARNNGIAASRGDLVAFLDADDTWEPANLERKVAVLAAQPGVDWVFSDTFNADEHLAARVPGPEGRDDDMLRHRLLWDGPVVPGPCSNLVLRRRCLDAGVRFDPEFSTAADQDVCIQLAARFTGRRLAERLVTIRVRPTSMSRNIAVMERDHIGVYRKAERAGLFPSWWFKRQCFSNLYLILAGSWWVNGRSPGRGLRFLLRAVVQYPPSLIRVLGRLARSGRRARPRGSVSR